MTCRNVQPLANHLEIEFVNQASPLCCLFPNVLRGQGILPKEAHMRGHRRLHYATRPIQHRNGCSSSANPALNSDRSQLKTSASCIASGIPEVESQLAR